VDEHYARLRRRALDALARNERGDLSDDELIYTLVTTADAIDNAHARARRELQAAADDLDLGRFVLPPIDETTVDCDEGAARERARDTARRRAREALG
jgi:hypothetical protein